MRVSRVIHGNSYFCFKLDGNYSPLLHSPKPGQGQGRPTYQNLDRRSNGSAMRGDTDGWTDTDRHCFAKLGGR